MTQITSIFHGTNPSNLYLEALHKLLDEGEEYNPRGKKIKELRPAIFEFQDPLKRITFLKGRVINPFFQVAESLWIAAGRSDVASLTPYNASIAQFSDDGEHFNAPYGERLRHWGKNNLSNTIINPIDQLADVYRKLKADPDTRQAVGFIGNPHFDNSEYTLNGGKDIACNINIKFKIRKGKLDINVDNRSNDLHWGTFGANLCQFTTLQELMATWLAVDMGVYFQDSDSLHIYTEDYGHKETEKVLRNNGGTEVDESIFYQWEEPRMSYGYFAFQAFAKEFFEKGHVMIRDPRMFKDDYRSIEYSTMVFDYVGMIQDDYWRMVVYSMIAKQAHNNRHLPTIIEAMRSILDCSWKVSFLRFLSKRWKDNEAFRNLYSHYPEEVIQYIERTDEV